jgi:small subunit ribosomal protein S16
MSVKIRMTRTGSKNSACFRVIATDSRAPRDGRFIEILGWYDPKIDGPNFRLKMDRVDHWLGEGALVSDSVRSLVKRARKGDMAEEQATPAEVVEAAEEAVDAVEEVADEAAEEASADEVAEEATEEAAGEEAAVETEAEEESAEKSE